MLERNVALAMQVRGRGHAQQAGFRLEDGMYSLRVTT